jgi:hypothetical protein
LKPNERGAEKLKGCTSDQCHIVGLDVTSDESVEKVVNVIKEKTDGGKDVTCGFRMNSRPLKGRVLASIIFRRTKKHVATMTRRLGRYF